MQKVNLDLIPEGVNPIVYASQNDDGRTIRFQLVSGGDEWTLSGNETITAKITKPDGTAITIPITNPGSGKHYVDLVNGASDYDQDGVYLGEVSIVKGSKTIGTGNFVLKVEADAYDAGVKILTASGNPAAFNTDLADILADCACELPYNSNGYKSATVINTSNTAVENQTPYALRQTPITANRCLEKLIGVSCAFNQLIDYSKFISVSQTDYTLTPNNDGSITVEILNTISSDTAVYVTANVLSSYINIPSGHKYAMLDNSTIPNGIVYINGYNGAGIGLNAIQNGTGYILLGITLPSGLTPQTFTIKPNIIDLTAMFGSEVADYLYNLENG